MQFCVYVTAFYGGIVHIEAENEQDAKAEAEHLFQQHYISWDEEEITDVFVVLNNEGGNCNEEEKI